MSVKGPQLTKFISSTSCDRWAGVNTFPALKNRDPQLNSSNGWNWLVLLTILLVQRLYWIIIVLTVVPRTLKYLIFLSNRMRYLFTQYRVHPSWQAVHLPRDWWQVTSGCCAMVSPIRTCVNITHHALQQTFHMLWVLSLGGCSTCSVHNYAHGSRFVVFC